MKATKLVMGILAVILVGMLIAPSYADAATTPRQTVFDLESEHESDYNKTRNIANNSTHRNDQTWTPEPKGVFVGSATQESHYQMQNIASEDTNLMLTWESQFASDQIMSGSSEFVVRTPLHVTDNIQICGLTIYAIENSSSYSVSSGTAIDFDDNADPFVIFDRSNIFTDDTTITDGNDVWAKNDRLYTKVTAPIVPDQLYLFSFEVEYDGEDSMEFYIAPNDVCNDGVLSSRVSYSIPTDPDMETSNTHELECDLGYSYDFRQGMGGGMTAQSFYLNPGDVLQFEATAPKQGTIDGYHTLMVPFKTNNGTAKFKVLSLDDSEIISENRTYDDYVLASTDSPYNASDSDRYTYTIQLISQWEQRVQFYFEDQPFNAENDASVVGYNSTRNSKIDDKQIGFQVLNRYKVCTNESTHLDIGEAVPDQGIQWDWWEFAKTIFPTFHLIDAIIGEEKASNYAEIGWGLISTTGPGLASGQFAWWLASQLHDSVPSLPELGESITGTLRNVIDGIWNVLNDMGEFLWSIGEELYDALTWLADQINEYGAYLLGMGIVMLAVVLFVFVVWSELKILNSVYLLAQGRTTEATRGMGEWLGSIRRR